ncbi:MAG TPA: glycosyltransferase family 2 protein [Verrucomicrobiae bacterium]|nr:glycosyltransferase family 2 protein [Verrucomicrobiae bacterium]
MNALKISIITPSFNSENTIRECVESVQNQSYKNWEHLVMDGGSKDNTISILRQYGNLTWISEKDHGHYDAMNKGIAKATGDLIVILNSDDCFRPETFAKVVEAFQRNESWDALFGDVIYVDAKNQEIYRRQEAVYDYKVLLYALDYICHQTLFVRREVYARIGNYRHKDFFNAADFEFKLRLGKTGCKVGHISNFLVNYRYHSFGQSADLRITRNMEKEAAVIRREYGNAGGWWGGRLRQAFRVKRQIQKLFLLGKCDLVPGTRKLRSHMREKTEISSNVDLDKLSA